MIDWMLRARTWATAIVLALLPHVGWFVVTRDLARLGSALGLVLTLFPIQWWALRTLFTRARLQAWTGWRLTVIGVASSAAVGLLGAIGFFALASAVPELGLRLSSSRGLTLDRTVLFGLTQSVTHFGLWALASLLPVALEDARLRQLQAEQLQTAAALERLRANLQPHFLLNTLNAIAGLVTEEPKQARQLLVALGDLLRDAVAEPTELEPLSSQIAWLKRYAQILETRHRGDLGFEWHIESDSEGVVLPRLLLQPLVENAVTHGALQRSTGAGRISVRTHIENAQLTCTIEDNGPGFIGEASRPGGFGLESVRRRVELKYGSKGSVTLEALPTGARATVRLPAERA